jgi:hypothetical protein
LSGRFDPPYELSRYSQIKGAANRSGENPMNAWSEYLRGQAVIADRHSESTTALGIIKEFADIAAGFRRDADAEDANPTWTDAE